MSTGFGSSFLFAVIINALISKSPELESFLFFKLKSSRASTSMKHLSFSDSHPNSWVCVIIQHFDIIFRHPVEYHNWQAGHNPWSRVFHSYVVPLNVFALIVCLPKFFESTVEWENASIHQNENESFSVSGFSGFLSMKNALQIQIQYKTIFMP